MQIIPVIDLKSGHVVHAKAGNRNNYQPLYSPLCQSSDVFDVIAAYLALYPFDQCYIADLDAITDTGNHRLIIDELLKQYPTIEFIVDAGFDDGFFSRTYLTNHTPVLGSECLSNDILPTLIKTKGQRYILSLDYTLAKNLGPESLFKDSRYWPEDIIVMSLNSVGSFQGPDFARLQHYQSQNRNHAIIAAGGIRNMQDLEQLKKMGIDCALVASALHTLAITQLDIQSIYTL